MAASQGNERPLPRFGEWDVNDPRTAEGFTVIFAKASDEKKSGKTANTLSRRKSVNPSEKQTEKKNKWLCCIIS